uniref:Solute carrier family 10 member 4 n=1 Tax=Microcebus murinus TaxID=30608 RepID=A0A8C5XLF2_MICMU
MPLCLWIYSRAWIDTPVVQLLPLGTVILTLCSTLIPIGLGVFIRYRYSRVADYIVKGSLWSLLVTLVVLFILTGTMLGPELLATIPATVYMVAIFMPLAGYASGYGLATLFRLPANCKRTVCLETGSQNVQLCTAILKLFFWFFFASVYQADSPLGGWGALGHLPGRLQRPHADTPRWDRAWGCSWCRSLKVRARTEHLGPTGA